MIMTRLITFASAYTLAAAACYGSAASEQSVLNSAGIQAERLEFLWWVFFYICSAVYIAVIAVLIAAILRRRRSSADTAPEIKPSEQSERRVGYVVKAAVGVTLVTLFVLMITSFRTGSSIASLQA